MILVDTSVWIEFFRGKNERVISRLRELLDQDEVALSSIVYLEILNGVRLGEAARVSRVLSALPRFPVAGEHFDLIEKWLLSPKKKSHRFGVGDLLIAAAAHLSDADLWSLDRDFEQMEGLGMVKLLRALG